MRLAPPQWLCTLPGHWEALKSQQSNSLPFTKHLQISGSTGDLQCFRTSHGQSFLSFGTQHFPLRSEAASQERNNGPPGSGSRLRMLMKSPVCVFYCCLTNHHKHSHLKQHRFIISQFPWVMSLDTSQPGSLPGHSRPAIQAKLWLLMRLRALFEAHSGCFQNSVPCISGGEVPLFLLAVGQGSLSILATCPPPRDHVQARGEHL